MTLREVYTMLEDIAMQVPDIRTCVVNDILKINEMRDIEYGVFGVTQNQHTTDQAMMRFSLNLFYVDRLVNSQANEVEIQSHGIEILRQILLKVSESVAVTDIQFTTFTQRFQDLCAGTWAMANISCPIDDCAEIFES